VKMDSPLGLERRSSWSVPETFRTSAWYSRSRATLQSENERPALRPAHDPGNRAPVRDCKGQTLGVGTGPSSASTQEPYDGPPAEAHGGRAASSGTWPVRNCRLETAPVKSPWATGVVCWENEIRVGEPAMRAPWRTRGPSAVAVALWGGARLLAGFACSTGFFSRHPLSGLTPRAGGPRALDDQTRTAVVRDYLQAWKEA
jgi:hypothetical protein